jgi:hypothetical protein
MEPSAAKHQHNSLRKLFYWRKIGALPMNEGLHAVTIIPDNGCRVFREQRCHGDPDLHLAWIQPGSARNKGACDDTLTYYRGGTKMDMSMLPNVLWLGLPTSSQVEDLIATIEHVFEPEGRYHLIHMALITHCVEDFVTQLAHRGYRVDIAETLIRYTLGTREEYFTTWWIARTRAAWPTPAPALHLVPDNYPVPLEEPASAIVPIAEYWQKDHRQR